ATAYEHALREAPDFADAARAWFLLGQAELALGFTPEAGAAFRELVRRFPASPLLDDARLGQAAALRLRRRPREARRIVEAVLAQACGQVRCRAALEAAAETRAAETPAAAADAYRGVAGTCPELRALPGFPLDYAEALALAGDVDGARRVLAHAGHVPGAADDEARLRLLAGRLAADAAGARAEYEQALAQRPAPALAVEAKMRLALLEAERTPERTVQALADLAATPAPHALRAVVLGEAAEVAASAGRFEQALALLARAAALGPEGAAQAAGRRAEILARWLAALDAQGDAAGVATVYAAYTTEVEESAAPAGRATVAYARGGGGDGRRRPGRPRRGGDGAPRCARWRRPGERAPPGGAGPAGECAPHRGGGRGGGGGVEHGRGHLRPCARGGRHGARAHARRGRAGPHRARPRRAGAGHRGAGRAARDGRRPRTPGGPRAREARCGAWKLRRRRGERAAENAGV